MTEPSHRARITRRALLIGGGSALALAAAGAIGIDTGVLPGRSTAMRALGLDGPAGVVPTSTGGVNTSGSFTSTARAGRDTGWTIAYPPGSSAGDALPVLVSLHGYGGSHASSFGHALGLDHFLAQSVAQGGPRFAIASVDGGGSYWHHRTSGEDAGAMVTDEFIPLLASHGLLTERVGLLGWSMGGYGALLIAARLGSAAVAAVVAESPALWQTAKQSPSVAFDGAKDFAEHELWGRQRELDGIPVRVDCGTGDGFYPNARDYVAGFATAPAGGFTAGGHNYAYWRRMAPAQLAFVGTHLA